MTHEVPILQAPCEASSRKILRRHKHLGRGSCFPLRRRPCMSCTRATVMTQPHAAPQATRRDTTFCKKRHCSQLLRGVISPLRSFCGFGGRDNDLHFQFCVPEKRSGASLLRNSTRFHLSLIVLTMKTEGGHHDQRGKNKQRRQDKQQQEGHDATGESSQRTDCEGACPEAWDVVPRGAPARCPRVFLLVLFGSSSEQLRGLEAAAATMFRQFVVAAAFETAAEVCALVTGMRIRAFHASWMPPGAPSTSPQLLERLQQALHSTSGALHLATPEWHSSPQAALDILRELKKMRRDDLGCQLAKTLSDRNLGLQGFALSIGMAARAREWQLALHLFGAFSEKLDPSVVCCNLRCLVQTRLSCIKQDESKEFTSFLRCCK